MKNAIVKLALNASAIAAAITLASCAHHKDVRPGADGVHRVVIQTTGDESEKREAIDQANHFCKERKQYAAFVTEEQKYTGQMDEKSYQNTKVVSKVLKTVGSGAYVFGGSKESNAGGIGVLAGQAAGSAIGQGYTVDMKFKCM